MRDDNLGRGVDSCTPSSRANSQGGQSAAATRARVPALHWGLEHE